MSDYSRFIVRWNEAHNADGEFEVPFPTNHVELPSPHINGMGERASLEMFGSLPAVPERTDTADSDDTP
jgi:hypothetical protein